MFWLRKTTSWQEYTELFRVFTLNFFICPGKVADTASIYKYKMQLKGYESGVVRQGEEPEELSGEYSGVNVNLEIQNTLCSFGYIITLSL